MAPEQRIGIIILTNKTGAVLTATLEKASELLLPLKPAPAATAKPALPLAADDLKRVAGVYANGDQRLEIAARENRLYLKRGNSETALVKRSSVRFGPENGPDLVMVAGGDGAVEYVNAGSRSFARVAK